MVTGEKICSQIIAIKKFSKMNLTSQQLASMVSPLKMIKRPVGEDFLNEEPNTDSIQYKNSASKGNSNPFVNILQKMGCTCGRRNQE